MKRKFNVIQIDGFKGIFFAVFAICCLAAGFLSFPGWVCMHIWNFVADFFPEMPVMHMVHGIMLWCIIALSTYALNKGNFSIAFGSSRPMPANDEKIKEILRKINEENLAYMKARQEKPNAEASDVDSVGEEKTVESEQEDEAVLK